MKKKKKKKKNKCERSEFFRNIYLQSSERILAEPGIEPTTSCSQVPYATDWALGLAGQCWKNAGAGNIV